MAKRVQTIGLVMIICSIFSAELLAQYPIQHQPPVAFERGTPVLLEFTVTGLTESEVQQATIFYRYDGEFGYQQQEVDYRNGVFSTELTPEDQSAASMEYYLEIQLFSGESIYYPTHSPDENPVQVQIIEEQEERQREQLEEVDFTILSPKAGSGVNTDDIVVAIALFYDPNDLPEGEFRLLIDGRDVTADADTSAYYISYIPDNLLPGLHQITLDYISADKEYLIAEWDFYVVQKGQVAFASYSPSYIPSGQVELTARNQVIAGDENNAYTGRTRFSGTYGDLRYSVNGYLTTQESSRLQPQNRFALHLLMDDWWRLEAGHVYPDMSRFTISGRRIFGVNTSVHTFNNKLNFQFVHGELNRAITNRYDSISTEPVFSSSGSEVDRRFILHYGNRGRGTFSRKLTGGRIGFGDPERFQIGLHAMKAIDDTTSLLNVRDYNDLLRSQSPLLSSLNPQDHLILQENPGRLAVEGGNLRPKGNFIMGTDLKFGLKNNRIRFESEAVVSSLNEDIYSGPLTVQRADDMGFDISQGTADMLESLSWLIIVNENMNTLPFRLSENEFGNTKTELFFPASIVAGTGELSVRYPTNNFRLQYRWIGPNFNSLANTTIRKDIAGFTVSDRFNLFSNRLYITLGAESLQDNVVGNRDATTKTNTYRSNVNWYPISRELPRVNFGIRYRTRDNNISRFNPFVAQISDENTAVQNLQISSEGDTLITAFPRNNRTVSVNATVSQQLRMENMLHDISLNFSNMKTTDEVFAYGDINNTALSLNLTSRYFELPLNTQLGLNFSQTNSGSGQNSIDIFGVYTGGNFFLMNDKLNIHARIAVTRNNITSRSLLVEDNNDQIIRNNYYYLSEESDETNFTTFALQSGAQYNINDSHALIFDASLTNVSGISRANDHVAQLRYIFRF